ncbi:hypothetical protein [Metabacillus iocasae]|uniref:PD-(D/E)XK endonuclease-like domain-containing protein n=1 Tax=Priestia iocasae TaxID=2291674 RepID=A0ABS2QZA8_9BACI|nr:hypothetical protein [Metabacillus iocasae]MBM7704819.1 hypothetical protein [Metabacillus iocasae]
MDFLNVHIKTISSEHLEEFIRCPYKFYQRQLLMNKGKNIDWRKMVQVTTHRIVKSYYETPASQRSAFYILRLIEQYWRFIHVDLFESKVQYYEVLAKVSDHLLQFLSNDSEQEMPLFLFNQYCVHVEELESNISLTIDVAQWTENSYVVKKFVTDDHPQIQQMMKDFIVVFSRHAFQKVPEVIIFHSILTGHTSSFTVQEQDYDEALQRLSLIKSTLKEPKYFQKTALVTECDSCPLKTECLNDNKDRLTMFM